MINKNRKFTSYVFGSVVLGFFSIISEWLEYGVGISLNFLIGAWILIIFAMGNGFEIKKQEEINNGC